MEGQSLELFLSKDIPMEADGDSSYTLRWADYTSNLTNVFESLLQKESFVDVTISTEAGKSLKCHKVVLSACSAYFQDIFVENPCQHPIVILRDVEWKDLTRIIEYMYKGQVLVGPEDLASLKRSAESLQIRGLVDLIKSLEISGQLSPPQRPESRCALKRRRHESPPLNECSPSNLSGNNNLYMETLLSHQIQTQSPVEYNHNEIMPDVKPGILEMIQEEQRAKMLEASQLTHNWMAAVAAASAASASSQADSNLMNYQYQLQSMWQKCWNNNTAAAAANMLQVAGIRYRERGPMKSWRPETMAEAIWSVLQEGLSLSQAARTHDIPYPTFVLYANRVHNMLGPSRNGGSPTLGELRPKGRGRPQRILLGNWPESHVRQVIRAVVFREGGLSNSSDSSDSSLLLPKQGATQPPPPPPQQQSLEDTQACSSSAAAAATTTYRPPSVHSERDYSSPPPRKVSHTPPAPSSGAAAAASSELLSNQLKALYGSSGSSSASSLSLMAAMGGPLSELIMKEMDFDPAMLKTILSLQGAGGVFEDAEEMSSNAASTTAPASSDPRQGSTSQALNEEALLNAAVAERDSYDNHRAPSQGLISMGES